MRPGALPHQQRGEKHHSPAGGIVPGKGENEMKSLTVTYGGSGVVNIVLPSGKLFVAKMRRNARPHNTSEDIDINIRNAVKDALRHGQHWRVLGGGSVREVKFADDVVSAMEKA